MNDSSRKEQGLDLGLVSSESYRVLARKYRPATFADLIGQDAMVRTITNAFATGRIPQAWLLTGVRGVGKTTTARILARALNYELADDSVAGPTVDMPKLGVHCQAIMDSRHVDVIEMDAASHNSVDDIRQINEAVRYAPASARYKVYILDEVHMLSGAAFNALLKTLEEPPPHVKFIFATTEIRKVPVTVMSRCQRFDLRRVDAELLVKHLRDICVTEKVEAEADALTLIARAAEGSVRDALSLLDQAIAHAGMDVKSPTSVGAEDVRQMLGLADRARIVDLFETLMQGDIAKALKELRDLYDAGADPAVVVADLAEFTNLVTRVKIVPAVAGDVSLVEAERTRARAFAAALSMRGLSRTWQMLLKGLAEVQTAPKPIAAAEMVLVRIAHAADLPSPDDVIRSLDGASVSSEAVSDRGGRPPPGGGPRLAMTQTPRSSVAAAHDPIAVAKPVPDQPSIQVARYEDLITLAAEHRDLVVKTALERDLRLVRFEDGRLEVALEPGAAKTLVGDLSRKLTAWTGRRWMVVVSAEQGAPTLRAQDDARKVELVRGVAADPLVQAVLTRFPGAEIVDVRGPDAATASSAPILDGSGPTPETPADEPPIDSRDKGADREDES